MSRLKRPGRSSQGEAGNRLYVEDLEAWEKQTGIRSHRATRCLSTKRRRNGGFDISVAP